MKVKYYEEAKTRTKQIQHATRRKVEEKNSIHMHATLKTNCEEKNKEKKKKKRQQQKTVLTGFQPTPRKIDGS